MPFIGTETRDVFSRIVVENAADGIIGVDGRGRIRTWNAAAERIFGFHREEVLGRSVRMLVPGENRQRRTNYVRTYLQRGNGRLSWKRREETARRKDGSLFPIDLHVNATEMNGMPFFIGIIRDLTEEKIREAKLKGLEAAVIAHSAELELANQRLKEELETRKRMEVELRLSQKLEAVGQLAAGIAHEINTPVQYLGDGIHFLRMAFRNLMTLLQSCKALTNECGHELPEKYKRRIAEAEETARLSYLERHIPGAIERANDGVERVASIVRAMKEFAHPDSLEKTSANINNALLSTLTVARNEYRYSADVEIELGDIPEIPCRIGDLNQVFLNLIVNAAHAIQDKNDTPRGRIGIATKLNRDFVVISISDTGCGIPESIRSRIFDPFFTTKDVGRGTGQGLAIARTIVDRHGGTLTFESEVGEGTTFTVRLPIVEEAGKAEESYCESNSVR